SGNVCACQRGRLPCDRRGAGGRASRCCHINGRRHGLARGPRATAGERGRVRVRRLARGACTCHCPHHPRRWIFGPRVLGRRGSDGVRPTPLGPICLVGARCRT